MAAPRKKKLQPKKGVVPGLPVWPAVLLGVLLLCGGFFAFAYQWLSAPDRLPLRVVEVNGEFERLQRAEIQRTVLQTINGGFFACDMTRLRNAVLAMPWVEDVSIRRSWPDKLKMVVREQVPLARWADDALVSAGGSVFRPADLEAFDGLVRLSGPEGSQHRVIAFFQSARAAAETRGLQILEVEQDRRRHWWLRFTDGLTVSLGQEQMQHRLAQFFRVYPSLNQHPGRQPERVDMRYAHGFAVRWREVPLDEVAMNESKSKV